MKEDDCARIMRLLHDMESCRDGDLVVQPETANQSITEEDDMNVRYTALLRELDEMGRNMDLSDFLAIKNGNPLPAGSVWKEREQKIALMRAKVKALHDMKAKEAARAKHTSTEMAP